jgi:DNA-binding IscR family transcriptional regulator
MHLRGGTTTSETIAQMLHTQPSVVRRTMAALRAAGYVESIAGPGGGWALCRELGDLTVRDIYAAIAPKSAFAIGTADDNPACPVESAVNRFLDDALSSAEDELLRRLGQMRLSGIARYVKVPKA